VSDCAGRASEESSASSGDAGRNRCRARQQAADLWKPKSENQAGPRRLVARANVGAAHHSSPGETSEPLVFEISVTSDMQKTAHNYAFIDAQNLNLGIQSLGWKLDYKKFRRYLKEKYAVEVAYMFIGYVQRNQRLYAGLQKAGFVLIFKPVVTDADGKTKGNVGADLVLQVMTWTICRRNWSMCANEKAPLQDGT
jgi:hypothetical protein